MEISINLDVLLDNNLTISEYLYLKTLHEKEEKGTISNPEIYKIMDFVDEVLLQNKGYIRLTNEKIILRKKGLDLFNSKGLFLKFLNTFPIKTPSGRYLSPQKQEGKAVERVEQKWNKLFKNRPDKESRAIDVLEAELKWRKDTNQLEFIHNIEAWLNQADYEKFEYLLSENKNSRETEDLL